MVKQGDIIKVNLNPRKGHEQQGYRPYLCLNHELVNTTSNIGFLHQSVVLAEITRCMLS